MGGARAKSTSAVLLNHRIIEGEVIVISNAIRALSRLGKGTDLRFALQRARRAAQNLCRNRHN